MSDFDKLRSWEKCRACAADVRNVIATYENDPDVTGPGVGMLKGIPEFLEQLAEELEEAASRDIDRD